jgi:hypothetical protein
MGVVTRTLRRCVSWTLTCSALFTAAPAAQAKPLTADRVHERIARQGLGNWVGVELQNGTAFAGRIVSIDAQSFGLQLHNDPQITPVLYSDVVDMHNGLTRRGFWIFAAVGIGAVATASAVGFYELHQHRQLPGQPAQPVY